MMELKILTQEDYFTLYEWAQCNHKGPQKWEAEGSESKRDSEDASMLALKMQEGALDQ